MSADHRTPTPVISRALADGTLIETLYDAERRSTSLAIFQPGGRIEVEPWFDLTPAERLTPYSPTNNLIASGCVLLPSGVGEVVDKGDLVEEVRSFIHRYVDVSPSFEDIAAHYVLLTWVYDAFNELGYLRFRGDYGTGKTRALLAIGSLCYKPFFASGASTVSPIFHVLDAFGGTLVLDEADFRFSDATAELTKILNNGTVRGLPVLRTMANRHRELNPTAFKVFGPKLVGMRAGFSDQALESRFITEETGTRALRADIPIHLPDELASEALALRNKLLRWRFSARASVKPDPSRLAGGVEPRINQTALALLSVVDDEGVRARIYTELAGVAQRTFEARAGSLEAIMVQALVDTLEAAAAAHVSVGDVALRFNDLARGDLRRPMSSRWVGAFIRERLRLPTHKSRGVYVVDGGEHKKVQALASRYGIGASESTTSPLEVDGTFPQHG